MQTHPNLQFCVENLSQEEEYGLFEKAKNGDKKALDRLLVNNMHIARLIASKYRYYGLPIEDLFQEACLGMTEAVKTFNPSFGIKFASHASMYMRSSVLAHVIDNFRMVKFGTTKKRRLLFFNYRRLKNEGYTHAQIAEVLDVTEYDVNLVASYITETDYEIDPEVENEEGISFLSVTLVSDEDVFENVCMLAMPEGDSEAINAMLGALNDREKFIICSRWIDEDKKTLSEVGKELDISAERVRQLEMMAFKKMKERHKQLFGD